MAGVTIVDCIGKAATVARLTFQIDVCTVNSKTGLIVIKLRRLPCCRGVTLLTIVTEVRCLMVGIVGCGEAAAMTRIAV